MIFRKMSYLTKFFDGMQKSGISMKELFKTIDHIVSWKKPAFNQRYKSINQNLTYKGIHISMYKTSTEMLTSPNSNNQTYTIVSNIQLPSKVSSEIIYK